MRFESYYLISAKGTLKERAGYYQSGLADLLTLSTLWVQDQGGRTVWGDGDYLAKVKILYLARLWAEYGKHSELKQLLGTDEISIAVVDAFWTVECFSLEGAIEDAEGMLTPSIRKAIKGTGRDVVDKWIISLQ